MFFDRLSLLTRDCHFSRQFAVGAKMQIDLTGSVAWDLPLPSKPQCLNTTPIWAEGNERATHPLFASKRIRAHRLVKQLIQKPAAEYLALEVRHHFPRFSDESPFSVWLLLATFMVVSMSMGAALLQLVAVPVQ
jgi:hypothetical protein